MEQLAETWVEIPSTVEIKFKTFFERWGAESIVGSCKATPNTVLHFQNVSLKQIEYARKNGINVFKLVPEFGENYSIEAKYVA